MQQQTQGCAVTFLDQRIDDFGRSLQGFALDFRQLDSGEFRARTISIDLGGIKLHRRTNALRYALKGILPDCPTFYFPLKPHPYYANGLLITEEVQLASSGRREVFSIVPDAHDQLVVHIDEAELQQQLGPEAARRFQGLMEGIDQCRINIQRKVSLTRQLFELYSGVLYSQQAPDAAQCRVLRARILGLLQEYLLAHPDPQRCTAGGQERLLQRVLQLIESNEEHPFSLDELSHEAFASKRAIQYAFDAITGISPMRYVKLNRLNLIRKELLLRGAQVRISDLVNKYQFSNLGRLVREYTELFGERPRDTARHSLRVPPQPAPPRHSSSQNHGI